MNDLDDPLIVSLHQHINAIADMCNAHVKPWEPDSWIRSVRLFNELAKPYIDAMRREYMATRPKSSFPVAWCNSLEDLVPVGETDNYLD
jgi:hypothetical protein